MDSITSPFLLGTQLQVAWDSTSLGNFKRCPRLYYYTMIEGWTSKEDNVHLRFGIEFHQAKADYEASRANDIPHEDALYDTLRELLHRTADWRPDHKYKNHPNLVRTVVWYLDQFQDDPARTHILENGKPATEVSFRFGLDFGPSIGPDRDSGLMSTPYILCGHLDRIVGFNGELFVEDYKTTTSTPGDYFFNQFEPDNQMTLYTWASRIVLNAPVRGVIINCIQVAVGFSRFVRGFTYRTQDQLDEWMVDLRLHLRLAEQYASEGYWPQNDTACNLFGGCRFRQICSKSPGVRHRLLEANFTKGEPWNPLISR